MVQKMYKKYIKAWARHITGLYALRRLRRLGLRKTAVGAARLCADFLQHILTATETAARFLYRGGQNVAYNRNVICNGR
jgi:hypothetical protein